MTKEEAAGMLAVGYMAEIFLPEVFKEEGYEDAIEIIKHYGGLLSGLAFSALQKTYGTKESEDWHEIHSLSLKLVDKLVGEFLEIKDLGDWKA